MAGPPGRLLDWAFGEEGSVAAETDVQVVMAATGAVLTGIYLVSPIVSALASPFAVSEAAVGQLITAFTAPSILLVPVFGVLADRYGRRVVLVAGLVAFGLGGGAIALAPSYEVAFALRLVQGVGFAAVNPVGVAIIGDAYSGSREATAQGLRVASIRLASLVVPPTAGTLVLVGWRYPFLLYLLALPIAAWAWRALPASGAEGASSLGSYASDLRASLATPALAAAVVSFVARYAVSFSFVAYVSVLLAGLGASSVAVGALLAVLGVVSIVATSQAGRATARVPPALVVLAGFVGLALGMVTMGLAGSYLPFVAGLVVYGASVGLSGPVQKSLVTQLSPPSVRAGTVSSALTFQSIGSAGGPFLMGLLLSTVGVGPAFVAFGLGFGLLGAVLAGAAHVAGGSASPGAP